MQLQQVQRIPYRGVIATAAASKSSPGAEGPAAEYVTGRIRTPPCRSRTSGLHRGVPSRIGHLLDAGIRDLEAHPSGLRRPFVVIDPGTTGFQKLA